MIGLKVRTIDEMFLFHDVEVVIVPLVMVDLGYMKRDLYLCQDQVQHIYVTSIDKKLKFHKGRILIPKLKSDTILKLKITVKIETM